MNDLLEDYCKPCQTVRIFRKGSRSYKCVICRSEIAAPNPLTFVIAWNQIRHIQCLSDGIMVYGEAWRVFLSFEPRTLIDDLRSLLIDQYHRQQFHTILLRNPVTNHGVQVEACLLPPTPAFWTVWKLEKARFRHAKIGVHKIGPDFFIYCERATILKWITDRTTAQLRDEAPEEAQPGDPAPVDHAEFQRQIIDMDHIKEKSRRQADYDIFENLLTKYFTFFGATDIIAIVINPLSANRFTRPEMDDRFDYYQFIKFKFRGVPHILTTLPFRWFTDQVPLDPAVSYPKAEDPLIMQVLALKETEIPPSVTAPPPEPIYEP